MNILTNYLPTVFCITGYISRFTIQIKLGEYRFYVINFRYISQVNQPKQRGNGDGKIRQWYDKYE